MQDKFEPWVERSSQRWKVGLIIAVAVIVLPTVAVISVSRGEKSDWDRANDEVMSLLEVIAADRAMLRRSIRAQSLAELETKFSPRMLKGHVGKGWMIYRMPRDSSIRKRDSDIGVYAMIMEHGMVIRGFHNPMSIPPLLEQATR